MYILNSSTQEAEADSSLSEPGLQSGLWESQEYTEKLCLTPPPKKNLLRLLRYICVTPHFRDVQKEKQERPPVSRITKFASHFPPALREDPCSEKTQE